jgi:hypothetical protein
LTTDKRVLGIALVSLILASLLILSIAGEAVDQPVEILENMHPTFVTPGRSTFTFSLVARESFEKVQIRFIWATPAKLDALAKVDPSWEAQPGDGPEDVFGNVLKLAWFQNKTSRLGIQPDEFGGSMDVDDSDHAFIIYDYSDIIDYLSGRNATKGLPMTFTAIINETRATNYYEGFTDFIDNPMSNIEILSISHNEKEVRYVPPEQVQEDTGRFPVSEAPRGFVEFDSVEKDDTLTVVFTVEAVQKMIQMIRVYLDGEPFEEPIINVIG